MGREDELEVVLSDLLSGAHLVALEGDYGVGKSSLAAVAAHRAAQWGASPEAWFLPPAGELPLELKGGESTEAFEKRVYFRIAAAILPLADRLLSEGFVLANLDAFRQWLNSPGGGGWSAGIGASIAGFGGNITAARSKNPTSSSGFTDSGVITLLDSWLMELFGTRAVGGVFCILDNLEVLGSFDDAVVLFEALRDRMFKRSGLVWIVCGAEGMVRTAFNTPKMSGVFQEPIDVAPLEPGLMADVIRARAEVLKRDDDAVLPVSPEAFEFVYRATGENLRFALGLADNYSLRAKPAIIAELDSPERDGAFYAYVRQEGIKAVQQLSSKVGSADWKVLTVLVQEKSGNCSPGEFADFGYGDMPPLLARVKRLEQAGLIRYVKDDQNKKRRMIMVENSGRLAVFSRGDA